MLAATPITSVVDRPRQAAERTHLRLAADRRLDPAHGGRLRVRWRRAGRRRARLPRPDRHGARARGVRAVLLEPREADPGGDRRSRSSASSRCQHGLALRDPVLAGPRDARTSGRGTGPIKGRRRRRSIYLNPFIAQADVAPTEALCAHQLRAALLLPVPRDVPARPERDHLRQRLRRSAAVGIRSSTRAAGRSPARSSGSWRHPRGLVGRSAASAMPMRVALGVGGRARPVRGRRCGIWREGP